MEIGVFLSQSKNVMREFIFLKRKLILVEEDTLHVTLCRLRIHVTLSTATKQIKSKGSMILMIIWHSW